MPCRAPPCPALPSRAPPGQALPYNIMSNNNLEQEKFAFTTPRHAEPSHAWHSLARPRLVLSYFVKNFLKGAPYCKGLLVLTVNAAN